MRLVFEPKTSSISQEEFITTLLAQTSLETSSSINLTMVGIDGKPTQKSLRQMLEEWIEFRAATVEKRSKHRHRDRSPGGTGRSSSPKKEERSSPKERAPFTEQAE